MSDTRTQQAKEVEPGVLFRKARAMIQTVAEATEKAKETGRPRQVTIRLSEEMHQRLVGIGQRLGVELPSILRMLVHHHIDQLEARLKNLLGDERPGE